MKLKKQNGSTESQTVHVSKNNIKGGFFLEIIEKQNGYCGRGVVIDTSSLMENSNILDKLINLYIINIPVVVIEELDNLKTNKEIEKSRKARKAIKQIDKYKEVVNFIWNMEVEEGLNDNGYSLNDNIIVTCAIQLAKKSKNTDTQIYLLTEDYNLKIKAEAFGVKCLEIFERKEQYKGYKEVCFNANEMCYFYEHLEENTCDCLVNEYLIVKNTENEIVDKCKWNGESYVSLKYKKIDNRYIGKVSPRNTEQELAFDLLQDNEIKIKIITGRWGSGKTYMATCVALELLKNKKFDKILLIRNNISLKDTKEIGYLKGSMEDKIFPFIMPFADKVGGKQGLEFLMSQGKIEVDHIGFMRGRDLRNTIVILTESENTTKELVQLLISRIGENSILILDGDVKQIDSRAFEDNNGLTSSIDKLKGNRLFGVVQLQKTERSETAELSYLLD